MLPFNFFRLSDFLFSFMMMFATGSVATVGTGGGDDGGSVGGTTGGDSTGEVSSEGDSGATYSDADSGDAGIPESDGTQTDPNATVDLGGGRTVPAKIDKLFQLAKAQGVEKEVRELYFGAERLKKAIPGGVKGAIELAKSVEEFGGPEGIVQMREDLASHTEDGELFAAGDPRWIQAGFEENPEAAMKAMNNSISYIMDNLPEQYDHVAAKFTVAELDSNSPVSVTYHFLARLKDNPEAQQAAKDLAAWYNAVKKVAGTAPEKKPDAQGKALSERETKIEQREMAQKFTNVNAEVFPVMKSQVERTLEAEAKLVGVDLAKISEDFPGAFQGMMREIHQKIMATAVKDSRFVDKHYALVNKGDLKRAAAAVNAKHEQIVPEIVRTVAKASGLLKGKPKPNGEGGTGGTGATRGAAATQRDGTWLRVNAKPDKDSVDWGKTTQALQIDGKYFLKDGKRVHVQY
jgi:hypothetical protein